MPRKPPLSLVDPTPTTGPRPPRPLGPAGRALWDRIQGEFGIADCGGIELLQQVCEASDRLQRLGELIAADGEIIHTRDGLKAHPALRDEISLRGFICRTLSKLGITNEPLKSVGRPSSIVGWKP
jgi:hypothetical protein